MKVKNILSLTVLIIFMFFISGCLKNGHQKSKVINNSNNITNNIETNHKTSYKELDFLVENNTGKTIFVTCFSYIKRHNFNRWRWDKSQIYELQNNQQALMDIDSIEDKETREHAYASLAIFNNYEQAKDSTFELLEENYRLDLDKIYKLKNKVVKIGVEKYGFKDDILVDTIDNIDKKEDIKPNELDFLVKNNTGKNVYICCFVYQKKDADPVWRYDKTDVKMLKLNESLLVDIDTINNDENRNMAKGYLAIFNEDEKEMAEKSTFELLPVVNKITLGYLHQLKDKTIELEIEKYGILSDFFEYSIK